ncbi:hypothetical protein RND71_028623 [Anisodus tanguticus]|uniref:Uncharacterized protein n=1 Tax=Anisodus tanguticus TaxID=243964 RepID=A0AAE1RIS4_9SOLA|nr:hypothetical protein RND71_028623 [Anisodus tanguticus]
MASMGFNYAHLHVQQKRLKEKLNKMEVENTQSNKKDGDTVKKLTADGKRSKGKKIYPGGFASMDSNENLGENKE